MSYPTAFVVRCIASLCECVQHPEGLEVDRAFILPIDSESLSYQFGTTFLLDLTSSVALSICPCIFALNLKCFDAITNSLENGLIHTILMTIPYTKLDEGVTGHMDTAYE